MQGQDLQNLIVLARVGLQTRAANLTPEEGVAAYQALGRAEELLKQMQSQATDKAADSVEMKNEDGSTSKVHYMEVGNAEPEKEQTEEQTPKEEEKEESEG